MAVIIVFLFTHSSAAAAALSLLRLLLPSFRSVGFAGVAAFQLLVILAEGVRRQTARRTMFHKEASLVNLD